MGLGGSNNRAANAAADRERANTARLETTTKGINTLFGSPERQAQYGSFLDALRARFGEQLGKQRQQAERQMRFGLARAGLTGGSENVSANRRLGERSADAALDAESKAQGSVDDLRSQDNSTRLQLLGLAQGGADATTAATRGLEGLQMNLSRARNAGNSATLGDFFGDIGNAYRSRSAADAYRRGYGGGYG